MRWFLALRSLVFNAKVQQYDIYRSYCKSLDLHQDLSGNPFYNKYSDKISEVQRLPPEDVKELLEKNLNSIQANTSMKNSTMEEKVCQNDSKGHLLQNRKDLEQIMKVDAIQEKTAVEIECIWKEYHRIKDGVYGVLPERSYESLHRNLKQYPIFLFPLPRAQGYEFVMCNFLDHSCYFTSLLNYQAFKENAPVCLTVTYFAEFKEKKGIVLMRGEYDTNALKAQEAQCLTNQLQLYYGGFDKDKLRLVENFNKYPTTFKHMELISNFEYGLGK